MTDSTRAQQAFLEATVALTTALEDDAHDALPSLIARQHDHFEALRKEIGAIDGDRQKLGPMMAITEDARERAGALLGSVRAELERVRNARGAMRRRTTNKTPRFIDRRV